MKTFLGLLLALLAPIALAQSIEPESGNGATVASGGVTNSVVLVVRDANGRPRSGMTVTFEPECTYRLQRGTPPYACVTALPGEPLQAVSDSAGRVSSPRYQADATAGNAWVQATGNIEGAYVTVSFFWSIGAPRNPIGPVSGNNQVGQVN